LLKIPRRKDKFGNLMAKIFRLPEYRRLELDEIGSDVWELCDGETPVESLTKAICDRYKLNRRQAETSVTAYLKMLAERNLIALKAGQGQRTTDARVDKKRKSAAGTKRHRTI
ncbi:MAG: PqqD family protein, partial [bacterium]